VLFAFHLATLSLRLQASCLRTKMSVASGVLASASILAGAGLSCIEDQRSIRSSDLLLFYLTASAVLYVPVLRTLWLIPCSDASKAIWTVVYLLTVCALLFEANMKPRVPSPLDHIKSQEQVAGLWSRGFSTWVLPLFLVGYSEILQLAQLPRVDEALRGAQTRRCLESHWHATKAGRFRLMRATALSNKGVLLSAIAPRLALAAFTFAQPFLIEASVTQLSNMVPDQADQHYRQALVGAYVLTYFGIAVTIFPPACPIWQPAHG
jgi:ATP-binding cassette, subfamily C (CFTR/MRP), member 1